jgi:hypothetical protein
MRNAGVVLFLTSALSLYGLDFSISGGEAGIALVPEYNRSYFGCLTVSASGSVEFNGRYTLWGGVSLWETRALYEVDAAAGIAVWMARKTPLYGYLYYMFNTLPAYETHSHTVLPLIGFRGKYAGIALGADLRFSVFFDEPAIFESILVFDAYVNFYNTERFRIGLRGANFSPFAAGNFGAYYLSLNSSLGITKWLSLANDLELRQTGSAGLSFARYGIAYKMGVMFKWR